MRLAKLGHSCMLVEVGGVRLLVDPGCFASGLAEISGLTGVLITHAHQDHLDLARLDAVLAANPDARIVCDEASALMLRDRDLPAETARAGDVVELGVPVNVYGREHAVIHPDLPTVPNIGYLIADRFFIAGDAFTVPDKPVEILAVPVDGAWMKVSEAVDWLRVIRPRVAVPVHDHGNVFAEWIYHLLDQLGPAQTSVTVLTGAELTAV